MDKPKKYLVVGIAIAALICIVGYLVSTYASQVTSLVEKCKTEASQAQRPTLVCDPADLAEIGVNNTTGVQKEIAAARLDADLMFHNSLLAAAIIFSIFSMPYAWYFLLRRIRELRDAIAGR